MEHVEIRLPVDPSLWRRFVSLCERDGERSEAALSNLVQAEVRRRQGEAESEVQHQRVAASRSGDRLLTRLRALMAAALAEAGDWPALQMALARHCLALRPLGGGLALTDLGTGEVLCRASDVGPGYSSLIRRFGSPFPDHPNAGLAALVLKAS